MGMMDGQWMEIFRAGDYGDKGKYTPADLDRMVAAYDPAKHEAPLVLGHPEDDAPAMGWVESLRRAGNTLLAKMRQVQPQLEEFVRSGMYKKRSVAFYPDRTLRHVGFLGAMPPEVKGLADVKFRDGQFEAIDFNEEDQMDPKEMRNSFLEALKEFFGIETKPKIFSEADVQKASDAAAAAALKPVQDELTRVKAEFADLQKKHNDAAQSSAEAGRATLVANTMAGLKSAKRWLPAYDKMGVPALFAELAKSEVSLEFGEGDKKEKKSLLAVFAEFLKGLPELVPGSEIVTGQQKTASVVKFTGNADPASIEIANAASARAAEKKITFGEALTEIYAEQSVRKSGQA